MRRFNTLGPNIPAKHYTLARLDLIEQGRLLVHDDRYFTIWAPRQTGKSTYFRLLAERLDSEGYKVAHINFENYNATDLESFLYELHGQLLEYWGYDWRGKTMANTFSRIAEIKDQKLVLIIDEVEGINPEFFGQFLHSIRNVYHSRFKHGLKSVILVGVSNIVGVVQDNASPFNISDNLNVPYFTNEETIELLNQHEQETGQLFAPSVKAKISYITANQPGLVNAFAAILVGNYSQKPVIEYADYLVVEDWFLTEAIDKNIENIINKAQEYRAFVERLLFRDSKVRFQIHRKEIRLLYVNGIIAKDADGNVCFRVPLYQKCLHDAFYPYMNGESDRIGSTINVDEYIKPDGSINIDLVIDNYKKYALRRKFRYFQEKNKNGEYITLKEATLVYSFETYLNAFLSMVDGKSYMEAHTGVGRTDLIITVDNEEFVVEAKVYSDVVKFRRGKRQLAQYAQSLSLTEAIYLVFIESEIKNETVKEESKVVDGILIKTHLVPYNLDKDF
ncbi:MAG: AAA-like domain-containing protein [Saprospiraceae bacterium]|nr:AAA-like domain-containing protein [Saprospiraceae bacterium]